MQYFVEIVSFADSTVEKRIGPLSERAADRVEAGASINLNHDLYFTQIVPEEEA